MNGWENFFAAIGEHFSKHINRISYQLLTFTVDSGLFQGVVEEKG